MATANSSATYEDLAPDPESREGKALLRKAIGASAIGNATEWYDYGVYAVATAYITQHFFPGEGGMLLTLALLAVVSPHEALALAAPALMLGHLHRLSLLHRDVSWRHVKLLWLGALPVGGAAAMLAVPPGSRDSERSRSTATTSAITSSKPLGTPSLRILKSCV